MMRRVRRTALAVALATVAALAGPAMAQGPQTRGGHDARFLHGYRSCIDRTVAQTAAYGGEPTGVAEAAHGACRHLLALAGVDQGRREVLEQAAWSYALHTALRHMEGR
ncbi:MAG: hypothetical protein ACOY4F_11030 [Thermodesulfobacteriota bacterium]